MRCRCVTTLTHTMSIRVLASLSTRTFARTRIAPKATRYAPASALATHAFAQPIRSFVTTPRTMAEGNMKCVLIKDGKGPVENLYIGEEPIPQPKEDEIQVEIKVSVADEQATVVWWRGHDD